MKVCCPGSFDPITYGHLDVIRRCANIFEQVVVAVGQNTTKNYLFSPKERFDLVCAAVAEMFGETETGLLINPQDSSIAENAEAGEFKIKNVTIKLLSGLLVDFCVANECNAIVKGMRFATDFDYELQISHVNQAISGIETILLPAGRQHGTISSTIVREIALNSGDISAFVPESVSKALLAKIGK